METSDTVTSEAYGEYHMAYPIRGNKGDCQVRFSDEVMYVTI